MLNMRGTLNNANTSVLAGRLAATCGEWRMASPSWVLQLLVDAARPCEPVRQKLTYPRSIALVQDLVMTILEHGIDVNATAGSP